MNVSSFTLKVIAIVGMSCNHVANVFGAEIAGAGTGGEIALIALYSLGGLTFPIMAFLLTEGYVHTSNVARYARRLLAFAVVAQIPYSLLWGATGNVLFTLLISLGILYANENCSRRGSFWFIAAIGVAVSFWCDWGVIGPIMVYLFFIMKNDGARGIATTMLVPYAATGVPALLSLIAQYAEGCAAMPETVDAGNEKMGSGNTGEPVHAEGMEAEASADAGGIGEAPVAAEIPVETNDQANPINIGGISDQGIAAWCTAGYTFIGFSLATFLIMNYRGRRGRPLKWFFYIYYPLHLMIIWVVDCFII